MPMSLVKFLMEIQKVYFLNLSSVSRISNLESANHKESEAV